VLLLAPGAATATEPFVLSLPNGIEATLYPPDYILENLTFREGGETVLLVDGVRYRLVTDIADPLIVNKGDGSFHPMPMHEVGAALGEVRMQELGLCVRVLLLPYPRREVLDSSARGDLVLLTPGVQEIGAETVHFTVTHELGHIYQDRFMPDEAADLWERYAALRGIADGSVYHAAAVHKDRPHEVFAEDFRFLFGGPLSKSSGSIENPELALPAQVEGLEAFLRGLREARSAAAARLVPVPNPFNPDTEIRVQFEDPRPRDVLLRVFDAHGRQVRRLFSGRVAAGELRLPWDGRGDGGTPASSGVYFARLDSEGTRAATKLLLVK
jgi:hypothetical protein